MLDGLIDTSDQQRSRQLHVNFGCNSTELLTGAHIANGAAHLPADPLLLHLHHRSVSGEPRHHVGGEGLAVEERNHLFDSRFFARPPIRRHFCKDGPIYGRVELVEEALHHCHQ